MKKNLLILLLFLPYLINAQTIKEPDVVGTWAVIDGKTTSTELPTEVNQMMTIMIDAFQSSVWTFNEEGTFKISFKENIPSMMEEMKFLDNKLWKIVEAKNQIRIGTKEDNYNHLVLSVKHTDEGIKAYFSDTPIYLVLKKN